MADRLPRKLAAILYADVAGYSRLTGEDEDATHIRLSNYLDLLSSNITTHGGEVIHYAGDAVLATFRAVVDAVSSAIHIQELLAERNYELPENRKVLFRIGINLGDVIEDRGDVYGDGVNVAARLEALAEPGGICVSDLVRQSLSDKLNLEFEDLGERSVKNIARSIRCFAVTAHNDKNKASQQLSTPVEQTIRFCTAPDSVRIAFASSGQGTPIVKAANWLNHLEHDWLNPVWGHLVRDLTQDYRMIRYDQRGNGLSDWEVESMTFDDWVSDLEVVVDASGLDKFALLGISQGSAVSIAYATRHPDRVTHLIIHGGYARGLRIGAPPEVIRKHEAVLELVRDGWTQDNPAFRQMFTMLLTPDASKEQVSWFNELTRVSTTPDTAARLFDAFSYIDVRNLLPEVRVPTLVTHSRNDARIPFELGREIAVGIPNARFVPLDSRNHLVLEQESAWSRFMSEIKDFLRSTGSEQ